MLEIKGTAEFIQRAKVPAPEDGVHVNGADGLMKGAHSIVLNGKLLPKGCMGIYYQVNDEKGIKVFYSLSWKVAKKLRYVRKVFRQWYKLYKIGIAPKPKKIVRAKVALKFKGEKHHASAYGIKTEHVNAPVEAWMNYAKGIPYDWKAVDHPDHNPDGFIRFKKWAKKTMKEHGLHMGGSGKLGDIMWSCRRNRWFWVDIDIE